MSFHKTALSTAVTAALGCAGILTVVETASAGVPIANGNYRMIINETPYGGGTYTFGTDGNWSSLFAFGCKPGTKGCATQAIVDRDPVTINGRTTGVGGNANAGVIEISVVGGTITGISAQYDPINNTGGGTFAQYMNPASPIIGGAGMFSGTVDANGNMMFTPTGLLGSVGDFPALVDERWNVDDFASTATGVPAMSTWKPYTTGTTNDGSGGNVSNQITGNDVTAIGDVNSDGLTDYAAILVTAGQVGSDWQSFNGANYYQILNVSIVSNTVIPTPTPTPSPTPTPTPTPTPPPPANACFGLPPTILGTPGNDFITGSPASEAINGLGGNDVIIGFGGNDFLCGGDGKDTLLGGGGTDQINGGSGSDLCSGEFKVNCP